MGLWMAHPIQSQKPGDDLRNFTVGSSIVGEPCLWQESMLFCCGFDLFPGKWNRIA